jgi:hypothetical protein
MGCFYEINDTLLLTKDQGFPSDLLDIERHRRDPITLRDVEGKIFSFRNKPAARAFQLDPVRVYLFESTPDDKWLAWGRAFIESITIERKPGLAPTDPTGSISFKADDWITSGTFRIFDLYDPAYQETFTSHEAPAAWNYFAKKC